MAVIWSSSDPELELLEDEDSAGQRLILRVAIEEEVAYVPLDLDTVGVVARAIQEAAMYLVIDGYTKELEAER